MAGPRIDLLESRAAAGECDLVAKGRAGGFLFSPTDQTFGGKSDADLRAAAGVAGGEIDVYLRADGNGVASRRRELTRLPDARNEPVPCPRGEGRIARQPGLQRLILERRADDGQDERA